MISKKKKKWPRRFPDLGGPRHRTKAKPFRQTMKTRGACGRSYADVFRKDPPIWPRTRSGWHARNPRRLRIIPGMNETAFLGKRCPVYMYE